MMKHALILILCVTTLYTIQVVQTEMKRNENQSVVWQITLLNRKSLIKTKGLTILKQHDITI